MHMPDSPSPDLSAQLAAYGSELFECSPDCVKLLDSAGHILAMNQNGRCAMEIDDFDSVCGAPWASMWPRESGARIEEALSRARSGAVGHFSSFCPTAKGTPRWWDVTVSSILSASNGSMQLLAVSRDITSAHRATQELRASEARFRSLVTASSAIVWNTPLNGRFESVQQSWSDFTGQRFDQYAGTGWLAAVHPNDRARTAMAWETAFAANQPFVMEHRLCRADGHYRHMSVRGVPVAGIDGSSSEWVGVHTDITDSVRAAAERKTAEIALYKSRERFQKIVDQAATGVIQSDTEGLICFVNRKYCDMLGYDETDLIGRPMIELTAPDYVEHTVSAIDQLKQHRQGIVIDKQYVRHNGTLLWATCSINLLSGPDGQFQGLVAIVLDISDHKAATAELYASEQRYRTLFDSTDQGVCILDMIFDTDGRAMDGRLVEFNAQFGELSSLTGQAAGSTVRALMAGLEQHWFDAFGEVARSGEPTRFESDTAAMSGRWFEVFATPMEGSQTRIAVLLRDVTERRKTDENLRIFAADLAQADRRKTEFLATLAHELRNPLAPIRSGLNVMRLGGDSPAAVGRVREMLERQVQNMVHLIDDLLDIARISSGKLDLRRTHADLNAILANAVETSMPLIESRQHRLTIDLPDGPLEADVDVTRIAQVVSNLLNNAAKYTPPGGRIALVARADAEHIVVSVTDSGVGIAADSLGCVFEMFAQIDRDVDRAQGGLGIGLSLVSHLVRLHGGSVSATSAGPGQGSTFAIRLPLLGAPGRHSVSAAPVGVAADCVPTAAHNILVVDDNHDAASTLAMILDAIGHHSSVAGSGAEALTLVTQQRPDAIFLDIGMPGMDGYETARALRSMPGMDRVTLIALTGWGGAEDRVRSKEAGFNHHLTKPVELSAVESILDQLEPRS